MKIALLDVLKKPAYLMACIGTAVLLFDFNCYLMLSLPGSRDEMCVMGVNLNAGNIIFSVVLSSMMAVMVSGLIALIAKKAKQRRIAAASLSGLGMGIGMFTFFCPICAIPLFSVSGISIIAQAFNDFNLMFKIASLVLLSFSLLLLNRRLADESAGCPVPGVKKS
jgi:hypothetical protein